MGDPKADAERWCEDIASLIADALMDGGLVDKDQFEKAQAIIAEELFVRLTVQDYPPRIDFTSDIEGPS